MSIEIKSYIFVEIDEPKIAKYCDKALECYEQNDGTGALKWCRKALKVCKKNGADPDTIATLHNYFGIMYSGPEPDDPYVETESERYKDERDYNKAVGSYLKALTVFDAIGNLLEAAIVCNNLAVHYYQNGEEKKAQRLFRKVAKVFEDYGEDCPTVATIYCNIALLCHFCPCDYEGAKFWFKKALDVHERRGGDDLEAANTYFTIASAYHALRARPEKVAKWYEKALAIREKILGISHPETGRTYDAIVGVYEEEKDYDKAIEWLQRRIDADLPENCTEDVCLKMGSLNYEKGDLDKALEWCEKSDLPFRNIPLVSDIYKKKGDYDGALEIYLDECRFNNDLELYLQICDVYLTKGEPDKAEEFMREAFENLRDPDLCFRFACMCGERGDRDRADDWFMAAVKLNAYPDLGLDDIRSAHKMVSSDLNSKYGADECVRVGNFYEDMGEHALARVTTANGAVFLRFSGDRVRQEYTPEVHKILGFAKFNQSPAD